MEAGLRQQQPTLSRSKTGSSSTRAYSSFSKPMKWFIVGLGGIAGVFSPIRQVACCLYTRNSSPHRSSMACSSNIFVPAIPTIASAFSTTEEQISLAVTVYLVFQAVTPSFFGSASDSFGRRPVYISTLIVYMGANVGLALCPTNAYWLLLVLRALQVRLG